MNMMTPVASKVSSRFASSRESPSGVGAPSHHMYLQCNLASMKVVAPIAKRARRIMVTSSRESPMRWEHPLITCTCSVTWRV